jgi:hypothetical protein
MKFKFSISWGSKRALKRPAWMKNVKVLMKNGGSPWKTFPLSQDKVRVFDSKFKVSNIEYNH